MREEPLGESAFILRDLPGPAHVVAAWLNANAPRGLIEAVASYESVGLYVDPSFDLSTLELPTDFAPITPRSHVIPVCYELGEDLETAAATLGTSADELIREHLSLEYTCFAIGFCPGFGYLGYLPESIRGVPRRASPRTRVEPGSVGMTGSQTAVYPLPRPGGWALIGRTPLTLVDVADGYFPLEAGDRVRFSRIDSHEFNALRGHRL